MKKMGGKRPKSWEEIKEKVANKRLKKDEQITLQHLTVQQMSSEVTGKWQKYERRGSLESVKISDGDEPLTIKVIKDACKKHFKRIDEECDILGGERGPSLSEMRQLPDLRSPKTVLHIRFIDRPVVVAEIDSSSALYNPVFAKPKNYRKVLSDTNSSSFNSKKASASTESERVVSSVPLSALLNLGKLIPPNSKIETIKFEEFSISQQQWLPPFEASFYVANESFESGGFRNAYKATALSGLSRNGEYVIKSYREDKKQDIVTLFQSMDNHTRKSVQMHALARNFAFQLQKSAPPEYGTCLYFEKVFYGTLNGQPITVEKFLKGKFEKMINNTGKILKFENQDLQWKGESFVHYTFKKSNGQLAVLDIQGVGYVLTDPEIASKTLTDENKTEVYFCSGNLAELAINTFFSEHHCNTYCDLLNLGD